MLYKVILMFAVEFVSTTSKTNRFHLEMQHNLQSIIETFRDDLKRQTYCMHVYTFLTDLLMLHLPLMTCIVVARTAMHWLRFQLVTHFSFIINFRNLFHDEQFYLDFQNAEMKWERTHIERISVESWNFPYINSNSLIAIILNGIYISCDVGPLFKRFNWDTDRTKRASTVKVVKLLMSTQFRKITLYTDNNKTKAKETYRKRFSELSMCKSSMCK